MTVLAVADEAEEVSFVSSTLGVTGVVLDGATAALTAATMVVAVFVFISVVTGLDSVAAGSDAPQEKQNLLPGGFDDLHEEHCTPLAAAVCVGAVSTLPHAEQNRFPGGLPALQAGHNESGWPAMKAPWAETASKFMENYILAGIEVKQSNHGLFPAWINFCKDQSLGRHPEGSPAAGRENRKDLAFAACFSRKQADR